MFDVDELEAIMCGQATIDLKDWKTNTNYKGGYKCDSNTIYNFWSCLETYN